ncbi:anthranilate phosphoribosyltransferase [Maridesulfovibrio hydrothermalis]|uniref:Anthranilate phosphoribosyltransferase n=1 Tax=Maridesulfovibrio hydrothermalis AM13 = DSM 14728 TaxID=1121451 RepID=L0RC86_9BACT|nr:anthranilate phosphoribosyltransferase [Maridesulfovibrio hydrothermalis]CCO23832.1 Anthranilate phosphoribosyltransferase [Maridesulfovibrio hydrothermalis AM13 = DSM 14728]
MSQIVSEALLLLSSGQDLSTEQADAVFEELFSGDMTNAQAGALLMGLRAKGETAIEVAAGVRAALREAKLIKGLNSKRIDTCGTGGDGSNSFNCSTAVALYLADMGYEVVKHGNRAVSSSCGSADVLEDLGISLGTTAGEAKGVLTDDKFVFLFAPNYHPAFGKIAPIRKELSIPTLFNLMGPLLNPARPTHQVLGVGRPEVMRLMAEVLALTDVEKAYVVHGAGAFDELTPFGVNDAFLVENGKLTEVRIDPADYGFAAASPEDVAVKDRPEALAAIRKVLAGTAPSAMLDMVALNLGAAVSLLDGTSLEVAMNKAKAKVAKGVDKEY